MYTINELATMTGLTSRTIRNYLRQGLLTGEMVDGVWKFDEKHLSAFFADSGIKAAIEAKNRAIVYDFLADDRKRSNALCVVLDLKADKDEAETIAEFFCSAANNTSGIRFSFWNENGNVRVTLSGPEDCVQTIMAAYYNEV